MYSQEELQREVARQFMAMRDGGWHVLDARQPEDALHAQARLRPTRVPALPESPPLLECLGRSAAPRHCRPCRD